MIYFQSIEEVMSALKRRMSLILWIAAIGCAVSVIVALMQDRMYNAIAVVQIEDAQVPGTNSSGGTTDANRSSLDARRTVQLIEQRVMARDPLFEIMDQYNLFNENPSLTATQRLTLMREAVSVSAILSGESWQPSQTVSGMVISVSLNDPQKAADVANNLLDRVMAEARTRSVDRAQVELRFFNAEEARIREEIVAAEAVVAEFKAANAEIVPSNITVLQGELTTLNTSLLTLRQQILSLESSGTRVRPEALERQVETLENQINLIETRIAEVNGLLARAPAIEQELSALERELTQLNEQFTVISRRKADAEMSQSLVEQQQLARFEVLERAIVPVYPVSRSKKQVAILGGIASLVVALGVAFILEMLNPPIRTAGQMERALGVRPVISVPTLAGGANSAGGTRKGSRFGLGAIVALLVALIALVAKPVAELTGITVAQRQAQ